jgi:hypothetical protein
VALPPIGQSLLNLAVDSVWWAQIGLPVTMGDGSTGQLLGWFKITAFTTSPPTLTLLRTA